MSRCARSRMCVSSHVVVCTWGGEISECWKKMWWGKTQRNMIGAPWRVVVIGENFKTGEKRTPVHCCRIYIVLSIELNKIVKRRIQWMLSMQKNQFEFVAINQQKTCSSALHSVNKSIKYLANNDFNFPFHSFSFSGWSKWITNRHQRVRMCKLIGHWV